MRRFLIAISKHSPVTRSLRYYYVILRNRILWLRLRHIPVQKNTIIFQAYNGRYTCSPKALYESMLKNEQFNNYQFIWVVRNKQKYPELAKHPRTHLVTYKSREYYRAFASAGIWVVNILLPLRIIKRKTQIMMQCWHGTPLKRLRCDIIDNTQNAMNSRADFVRKNRIDTRRYDYLVSPSAFATDTFMSAFNLTRDRILEIGYPRNDALLTTTTAQIQELKQKMSLPNDKKIVLYAPTWRDDQHDSRLGYTHRNKLDLAKLQQALGDNHIVLFRAHYLIASKFNFKKYDNFVRNVSDYDDINDLYLVSDVLVTDYSSVMFDYANTGKPMMFFMYDRKHYQDHLRGFYIDIAELPGDIISTSDQLITQLQKIDTYAQAHRKAYAAFAKRYAQLDDGHASARLAAKIVDATISRQHLSVAMHQNQLLTNKE